MHEIVGDIVPSESCTKISLLDHDFIDGNPMLALDRLMNC
jgi:hypothetical protein